MKRTRSRILEIGLLLAGFILITGFLYVMRIQANSERWLNRELVMLVEETGLDGTYGRTIREAPDADGTVCIAPSFRHEPGQYLNIRLLKAEPYDMIGESI